MSAPAPKARPASGVERAALVLLALGEAHGGPVWSEFDDAEAALLSAAIARLGPVEPEVVGAALQVFDGELSKAGKVRGTPAIAERLIVSVLPESRATAIVERLRRPSGPDLWERLATLKDQVLADYLVGEHPQTATVVLARLPAEQAGRVLSLLPRDCALACLSRFARIDDLDARVLSAVESSLREALVAPHEAPQKADPALRLADIFNAIDRTLGDSLLDGLTGRDGDTATRVREKMFTFEDFATVSPLALQVLLRGLDRDLLALALKAAGPELRARFLDQMSARAARMMEDQISSLGPVRRKSAVEAQFRIVSMARELEAAGELKLRPDAASTEEMVE